MKIIESDLIESLKEDPSFLAQKYNEIKNKETIKEQPKVEQLPRKRNFLEGPTRTGGVYVPPHKLAQLQKEIMQKEEKMGLEHQKLMWELLRKSINGIINKVLLK